MISTLVVLAEDKSEGVTGSARVCAKGRLNLGLADLFTELLFWDLGWCKWCATPVIAMGMIVPPTHHSWPTRGRGDSNLGS